MTRSEFSKSTKLAAWERCGGYCEDCGGKIFTAEYDHIVPCAIGGTNDLDNCRVLCRRCHRAKTSAVDVPQIAKSRRINEKRAGVRRRRTGFRGWRKFNGDLVWRHK
jgi:5-methylcytosine-specific restriction endonuclease McrA